MYVGLHLSSPPAARQLMSVGYKKQRHAVEEVFSRGPNPRVELSDREKQLGDPTRDMTRISRVFRNLAGRVEAGEKVFKILTDRVRLGRTGSDRVGPEYGPDRTGSDLIGHDRPESDRIRPDRIGLDRSGRVGSGRVG